MMIESKNRSEAFRQGVVLVKIFGGNIDQRCRSSIQELTMYNVHKTKM